MGTKVVFAGMEDLGNLRYAAQLGVRNVLLSYYYLRKRKNVDEFIAMFDKFEVVIIDSGAYTFLDRDKNTMLNVDELNTFVKEYKYWLTQMKGRISVAAELDLYRLPEVGEFVDGWRDELVETGVPIMPIYHGEHSGGKQDLDWVDRVSKKFPYMGVGSAMSNTSLAGMNKFFTIVRRNRSAVHGMGMTKLELLLKSSYYTADSTSWLLGSVYGVTYEMRGSTLKTWAKEYKDRVRKRNLNRYAEAGLDLEKILADDGNEINKLNMLEWFRFSNRVEYQNVSKSYMGLAYCPSRKEGLNPGQNVPPEYQKMFSRRQISAEEIAILGPGVEVMYRIKGAEGDQKGWKAARLVRHDKERNEFCFEKTLPVAEKGQEFVVNLSVLLNGWERIRLKTEDNDALPDDPEEFDDMDDDCSEDGDAGAVVPSSHRELTPSGKVSTLRCDDCYAAGRCPKYREEALCSLDFSSSIATPEEFKSAVMGLLAQETERVQRGIYFEKVDGGVLDKSLTDEVRTLMSLFQQFKDMIDNRDTIEIKAKGNGVIAQLFGNMKQE